MENIDRNKIIINLYKNGDTGEDIGRRFNLSRERVRQILLSNGIKSSDGGIKIRTDKRKAIKREQYLAKWMPFYRCTKKEYLEISPEKIKNGSQSKHIACKYRSQVYSSKRRGIEFNMSFPEWFKIWKDSGHLSERGKGKDEFVMARHMDSGAYEVGNVEIVSSSQNHKDAWKCKWCGRGKV